MTTPASGSPKPPLGSQAGLILVVDDEEKFRNVLFQSLTDTEFRGVGVASAAEALDAVKKSHPRTILLDWTLPGGINGLNLLKALKADPGARHIPVIMISGLPRSEAEKLAILKAGAEGFLAKIDLTTQRESFLELLRGAVAKNKSPSTWRLVVVEDDIGVQTLIRFALERREFEVHFSSTGGEGCRLARDLKPNLILLDMGLPDINGVEVCRILRADSETKGIPILAMTGLDRTAGVFESAFKAIGIEDNLPKPFGENELLLHISRLLKRIPSEQSCGDLLARGRVRIDVNLRCAWVGERLIESLGHKQFDLLHALMTNANGLSRKQIQSHVWGEGETSTSMSMTILRLRETLGFNKHEGIIAIPHGYKLVG
jgi:DNA-binding response OmpR family regulator